MTNKNRNLDNSKLPKYAIYGVAGALLAVGSPSILAQQVNAALNAKKNDDQELEIIQVTGVRSSLEEALNTKREAVSIVDAISATDIDALPALDLGEALQAIPGIQLNRDEEGRQSSINLRGLSGGFIKTTAAGQSFATPSRSSGEVGDENPFGAFEAGVFDGVTVVKSPTADMQVGGIAGVVDKKLQRALAKKDGKFSISLGGRYEALRESWDKEFKLSGSKHLIKDELAVAFKIAGSTQNFRRDTANFTSYVPLSQFKALNGGAQEGNYREYDAYVAQHNLPENAVVRAVALARNNTESSKGDRLSFTGNIEWKVSEALKLGVHLLYTKRALDDGIKEDTQISSAYNTRNPARSGRGYEIIPTSAPFFMANIEEEDGSVTPVYGVSSVELVNANYTPATRINNYTEEAKGLFLYADYRKGNWALDGTITYSDSSNLYEENAFDIRHQDVPHPRNKPTGISASIDTAKGDLNAASVDIQGWDSFSYSGTWNPGSLTSFSSSLDKTVNQDRAVNFYAHGTVDNPTRDTNSIELNAKRFVDFGFDDVFKVSSIKFGGRYANENLENYLRRVGVAGVDFDSVIDNDIFSKTLFSDTQGAFFNGNYPGAFNSSNGWQSIDAAAVKAALVATRVDVEGGVVIEPSGLYAKMDGPHLERYGENFTAKQTNTAAYFMTEFEGGLGAVTYTGNAGVRYVGTDNELVGLNRIKTDDSDELVPVTVNKTYNHLLPSINVSFELTDDVILRTAYSEALVRPNLRFQTPTISSNPGSAAVRIDLPRSDVEPYTADMYDLSLEWYNREGSAISVGMFHKEIEGLFDRKPVCPVGEDLSLYSPDLGEIEAYFNEGSAAEQCREIQIRQDHNGDDVQRAVIITRSFNSDAKIKLTGYELAVQQKLDFLPYPWNGFGGVFNYTHIEQETDGEESLFKIAPDSYNLIGYYENDGVSIRLSYNWRSDSILEGGSQFLGPDQRNQKAGGRLDLSSSYKINKGLQVFFRAFNLNDEQRYEYIGDNEDAVYRVDYTGRTYQVSLNYNF
ncbi:TonB-dependent receptor [Catenovulum agarivorans]|uniref:TonB-dependent receptor n=1 Tax=Catenovulum agarivorans TaxID=1172192 RepID=UPI00031957DA|nr:TonB-dependent receptor [Catenovulum agarivorans]